MFSLPAISSITSFLTKTVADEFQKLFKPASLVLAAIFTTLNLVLILPALRQAGVAPIVALEGLPLAWQLALATMAILTFGYLFNSLGGFFVGFVKGNAIRETPLGRFMLWVQQNAYDSYVNDLRLYSEENRKTPNANNSSSSILKFLQSIAPALAARLQKNTTAGLQKSGKKKAARAAQQLAYNFPDRNSLTVTRLGNVLASAASYTLNQYGAHFDVLWPVMDHVLEKEAPELQKRLFQNLDTLTFLASLTVILELVALEFIILQLVFASPLQALWALLLLLLAYVVYLASVEQAEAWGRDVRLAFDLFTPKLEENLKLRELKGDNLESNRKERLKEVSSWLAYGALELPTKIEEKFEKPERVSEWYIEESAAPQTRPVFLAPPGVNVIESDKVIREWQMKRSPVNNEWLLPGCEIEYIFIVSNTDSGQWAQDAKGVFLLVSDERLPAVPDKVEAVLSGLPPSKVIGERQKSESGKPEALLWYLGNIPVHGSCVLKYGVSSELHLKVITADVEFIGKPSLPPLGDLEFEVCSKAKTKVDIKMSLSTMNADQLPSHILVGDADPVAIQYNSDSQCGEWTLDDVDEKEHRHLDLEIKRVIGEISDEQ